MKRLRIRSTQITDNVTDFDDLYYEISHNWHRKAEALQIRRWRKLKVQEHLMYGGELS